MPPQILGEESPAEELPAAHGEPVEASTVAGDDPNTRDLLVHAHHAQLVTQAATDRLEDSTDDHRSGDEAPDRDPDRTRDGMTDEGHAGRDLVGECQGQTEVGVEVDHPP